MVGIPNFSPSLDGIVTRYRLGSEATRQLALIGALLASDQFAPTTVRDPARIRDDHLADALVALEVPQVVAAAAIADLGAGAGIPGLPLAIALPHAHVTLVESNRRKCQFIERAIALLGLSNAGVVYDRAEGWIDGRESCDVVTARALAPLDVVAEYAAPLLVRGGSLVAWRGRRDAAAEASAARAAEILNLDAHDPLRVVPYAGAEHRHLHVMIKIGDTPGRFPRRIGVAARRRLGVPTPERRGVGLATTQFAASRNANGRARR